MPETKSALESRLRTVRRLPALEQWLAEAGAELRAAAERGDTCRWSEEAATCRRLAEEAARRQAALAALTDPDPAAPGLQRRLDSARHGWRRLQADIADRSRLVQVRQPLVLWGALGDREPTCSGEDWAEGSRPALGRAGV